MRSSREPVRVRKDSTISADDVVELRNHVKQIFEGLEGKSSSYYGSDVNYKQAHVIRDYLESKCANLTTFEFCQHFSFGCSTLFVSPLVLCLAKDGKDGLLGFYPLQGTWSDLPQLVEQRANMSTSSDSSTPKGDEDIPHEVLRFSDRSGLVRAVLNSKKSAQMIHFHFPPPSIHEDSVCRFRKSWSEVLKNPPCVQHEETADLLLSRFLIEKLPASAYEADVTTTSGGNNDGDEEKGKHHEHGSSSSSTTKTAVATEVRVKSRPHRTSADFFDMRRSRPPIFVTPPSTSDVETSSLQIPSLRSKGRVNSGSEATSRFRSSSSSSSSSSGGSDDGAEVVTHIGGARSSNGSPHHYQTTRRVTWRGGNEDETPQQDERSGYTSPLSVYVLACRIMDPRKDEAIGVVLCFAPEKREPRLLRKVVGSVQGLLVRAIELEKIQRELREALVLIHLHRKVFTDVNDAEHTVVKLLLLLFNLTKAEALAFYVVDVPNDSLICYFGPHGATGMSIPLKSHKMLSEAVKTKQCIRRADDAVEREHRPYESSLGVVVKSAMAVPLSDRRGNVKAVVHFLNKVCSSQVEYNRGLGGFKFFSGTSDVSQRFPKDSSPRTEGKGNNSFLGGAGGSTSTAGARNLSSGSFSPKALSVFAVSDSNRSSAVNFGFRYESPAEQSNNANERSSVNTAKFSEASRAFWKKWRSYDYDQWEPLQSFSRDDERIVTKVAEEVSDQFGGKLTKLVLEVIIRANPNSVISWIRPESYSDANRRSNASSHMLEETLRLSRRLEGRRSTMIAKSTTSELRIRRKSEYSNITSSSLTLACDEDQSSPVAVPTSDTAPFGTRSCAENPSSATLDADSEPDNGRSNKAGASQGRKDDSPCSKGGNSANNDGDNFDGGSRGSEDPIRKVDSEQMDRVRVRLEPWMQWGVHVWEYPNESFEQLVVDALRSLNLISRFNIRSGALRNFFRNIAGSYHMSNAFHNIYHAVHVFQVTFLLLHKSGHDKPILELDQLTLLMAALCHDVDHPGVNNQYLISTLEDLAITYNDNSVLENHHCAFSFKLMTAHPNCDIRRGMTKDEREEFRRLFIPAILATDMAYHIKNLTNLKDRLQTEEPMNLESPADRLLLVEGLLHSADLANPVMPAPYYKKWASLVVEEFNVQVDREERGGVPITSFMDARDELSRTKMQLGFIEYVVLPQWRALASVVPIAKELMEQGEKNYEEWKIAKEILERTENAVEREVADPLPSNFTYRLVMCWWNTKLQKNVRHQRILLGVFVRVCGLSRRRVARISHLLLA